MRLKACASSISLCLDDFDSDETLNLISEIVPKEFFLNVSENKQVPGIISICITSLYFVKKEINNCHSGGKKDFKPINVGQVLSLTRCMILSPFLFPCLYK